MIPACRRLTLSAGSNYVDKRRFGEDTLFFKVDNRDLIPPGYMHFRDVQEVYLYHIEITDFTVFRREFPSVKVIYAGKRVQALSKLRANAVAHGIECINLHQ